MTSRESVIRAVGFALIAVGFAVTSPALLIGLVLAVIVVALGPWDVAAAGVIAGVMLFAVLGDRTGLWWFERGWPLLVGGTFVWVSSWKPTWSFSGRALGALTIAAAACLAIFGANPGPWFELDAAMADRATRAADTAAGLFGAVADGTVESLFARAAGLQALLFPALLGVSSLGALGAAVTVRSWLAREAGTLIGPLRRFRFNDHLIWIWVAGLVLLLMPTGGLGDRVGGNALLFMGVLYVLRGIAVLSSIVGGISLLAAVLGSLAALVLYPLLVLVLMAALLLGLGDTWLDVRGRLSPDSGSGPGGGGGGGRGRG